MIRIGVAAVTLVVAAGSLSAQTSKRVADAQPAKYQIPLCNLKNTKASDNGAKALRKAIEESDQAKKMALLNEARSALMIAVTQEPANAAGWYFLARYFLRTGDVAGIDSAFTKAETLSPSCEIDINTYRQNAWAVLANAGLDFYRQNETDSALVLFRQANTLFQDLPHVLLQTGGIFANSGNDDSAAVYLAKAAEVAGRDTTYTDERNSAKLNLGIIYHRLGRYPEAIQTLREYLTWNPDETEAQRALASVFRAAGMEDSASVLENRLVARFAAMNLDSLSTRDLFAVGVGYFNSDKYTEAADVFNRVLVRNSFNRDALYNLANCYLALKNWEKLETTAAKLREIEPLSRDVLQLLGQAQKELKKQEILLKTVEELVRLPVTIEANEFTASQTTARLTATATGLAAMDAKGTSLPAVPVTLVVDFLTSSGQVVGSKEIAIPRLEAGAKHDFTVEAGGAGIVGWRYKRKA